MITIQKRKVFRIGHLAERYGVSAEAIRQWERQGLIPPARRTAGGHRRYGVEHCRALDKIIAPIGPAMDYDELDELDEANPELADQLAGVGA